MLKTYKYRICPNKKQQVLLDKHFNACRFIYNLALETKMAAYSSTKTILSRCGLQVQMKELKKDCEWLKEINSQSLQSELMHLDSAYLKLFKGLAGFPKFKSKNDKQSFQCPQNVYIVDSKLKLPKVKEGIKIVLSRPLAGEIRTVTISKTNTNKYYASILVQDGKEPPKKKKIKEITAVGVDMGIKAFATLSDGQQYENPKYLKRSLRRLKMLQKRASKKKNGSANRKKANLKVAILHEKITNQRNDFLHKFSDSITKRYDTICVENLNVSGMIQNRKLSQAISDVSWSAALDMIKYKAEWRGKNYHEIGRFDASSKIHGKCGYLNKDLTLADREWVCPKCGETVDRDKNAAENIKQIGLSYLGVGSSLKPVEYLGITNTMNQEILNKEMPINE